jgi:predicted TIM-barrel fold metal-dependent hydrolase
MPIKNTDRTTGAMLSGEICKRRGEFGLPVLIHMDFVRGKDYIGLPILKRMLAAYPNTNFVLHSSHFWAEISGNVTENDCLNNKATKGKPITPGGSVQRIFEQFPNAYGDLSALSAFNNLTRFQDMGRDFLETWHKHLLFGSDYLEPGQACPNIFYIRNVGISPEAFKAITRENAERLLHL